MGHASVRRLSLPRWLFVALLLAVCGAAGAVAPQPVRAHTLLLSSDPPEGGNVDRVVSSLTLTFDENPQPGFTKITIYDTKQRPVTTTTNVSTGATPNVIVVAAPSLGTDGYAVVWQILSQDGHVARGAFTFTVQLPGEAAPAPPPALSTVLDASANNPPVLAVLLSGVRYAALGTLVGGAGVLLFCFLPALAALPAASRIAARRALDRRAQRWLFVAFGAALAAHLLVLLVQGAKATNSGLADALRYDLLNDLVRETTFGAVWRVQAIALLLLGEWLVLLPGVGRWQLFGASRRVVGIAANPLPSLSAARATDAPPVPTWGWGVALAGGLFLLGTTAFGGHAAAVMTRPALALLSDWVHLAAMSLWFGGVLLLAGLLSSPSPQGATRAVDVASGRRFAADVLARFSRLALVAIAVVTVTGVYNATQHTSPATLTSTGYGLALVGKVALVACVLLVAATNRLLVVPTMRVDAAGDGAGRAQTFLLRLVGAEVLLGIGVIGLTGLLTQLPPAYKPAPPPQVAAASVVAANQSEVVPSVPTLTIGEVRATLDVQARGADVTFVARVGDTANRPRADVERVTLLLDSGERYVGTITVPLTDAGEGRYTASGNWFSVGQHWLARVVVARPGVADTTLNFALQPRPVPPVRTQGAANAFPWPRFEAAAGIGGALALLGLAVALLARFAPVPFGARERLLYQWSGVAVVVVGVIVVGWFSTVSSPFVR